MKEWLQEQLDGLRVKLENLEKDVLVHMGAIQAFEQIIIKFNEEPKKKENPKNARRH